MSILIGGASFTSGFGLDSPTDSWPTVLSSLINQPITNTAETGASVDYVIYTIIKQLSNSNYKGVIIAWPPLGRTLLVRRENNFLVNGNPTFTHSLYGNSKEYKEYLKYFYKYWINDLFDLKFTLQKIITLQSYLKINNYKYLFINSDSYHLDTWLSLSTLSFKLKQDYLDAFNCMNDEQILSEELEINELFNQLDLSNYHRPTEFNLANMCTQSNLIDSNTEHPTIEGHKQIAKFIVDLWN